MQRQINQMGQETGLVNMWAVVSGGSTAETKHNSGIYIMYHDEY